MYPDVALFQYKAVFNMTGNLGRKRSISAFVVTGNGRGLAGFALGKAIDGKTSSVTAKNRAGQKLMFIERYNEHTGPYESYINMFKSIIIRSYYQTIIILVLPF